MLQELRNEIANFSPDIVHFAGFSVTGVYIWWKKRSARVAQKSHAQMRARERKRAKAA